MTKIFTGKLLNSVPKRKELLIPLSDEYLRLDLCLRVGMFRFYMLRTSDILAPFFNIEIPNIKIIGIRTDFCVGFNNIDETPCRFRRYTNKNNCMEDYQWFFLRCNND